MRKAFTLIELIFVTVVLGIISSVAMRGCSGSEYEADQAPAQYSQEYTEYQRNK